MPWTFDRSVGHMKLKSPFISIFISTVLVTSTAQSNEAATVGELAGAAEEQSKILTVTKGISELGLPGNFLSTEGREEFQLIEPSKASCLKSAQSAKNFCFVSLNPETQKAVAGIGVILGGIATVATMKDSCSKFGDALKLAQIGLAAYNGLCGTSQQSCESSCSGYIKALDSAKAKLTIELNNPASFSPKPLLQSDLKEIMKMQASATYMQTTCSSYKWNMAAAATGLTALVSSSALAGECKKKTASVDCTTDPMNAACVKALDCSKAENATNTTCICQRTPNTPGCSSFVGTNGNQVPQAASSERGEDLDAGRPDLSSPSLGLTPSGPSLDGNNSASLSADGAGGGGANGFSGDGGAGGGGGANTGARKINTNILSGYEGGGGGGAGGRGSSSRGNDFGLQAYLPKGAKDPNRNPANQVFGDGQVTGSGSKSNFEKVNIRYLESKSTLLAP